MNRFLAFLKDSFQVSFFVLSVVLLVLVPFAASGSDEESLMDDVTAMITNAKKLSHKIFIIDTSDSMNAFAYSDYINTCEDTKRNIDHAIALCNNSAEQCLRVASAATCADLDCTQIQNRCLSLASTKANIHSFCNQVENLYVEPGLTETAGYDSEKATRYVGPWDPKKMYDHALCFYNWTEDTEGHVLNDANSGHFSYDALPGDQGYVKTDRRDWDCLTDDSVSGHERSGLYLNWKYATSLDAVKIILGNVHDFSYKPKQRGSKKCFRTSYYPAKSTSGIYDPLSGTASNLMCYEEHDYVSEFATLDASGKKDLKAFLKNNWTAVKEEVTTTVEKTECDNKTFAVVSPLPSAIASDSACVACAASDGEVHAEGCTKEDIGATPEDIKGVSSSEEVVSVKYECCKTYECSNPKCRDNDEYCEDDSNPCYLGYYSQYDQDPNHCCDETVCIEDGTISGSTPEVCEEGIEMFRPGPGNKAEKKFTINNVVPALTAPETLSGVSLTKVMFELELDGPVEKVEVSLGYGCATAADEDFEADHGINPASNYNVEFTADGTYSILLQNLSLNGCSDEGYGIGGVVTVYHDRSEFDEASAEFEFEIDASYSERSFQTLDVSDYSQAYFVEYANEIAGSHTVSEYECKTTMWLKKTKVASSCPSEGVVTFTEQDDDGNTVSKPYTCKYRERTKISGPCESKKYLCQYLCRDEIVYDDPWKCRMFFSQMDTTQRNGPGYCNDLCYNYEGTHSCTNKYTDGGVPEGTGNTVSGHSIEDCCKCINHYHLAYKYLDLDTPEGVQFPSGTYNCSVSGFQEGDSESGRTFISGYQAEIVKGHFKETPAGVTNNTYALSDSDFKSPYEYFDGDGSSPLADMEKWYYPYSLVGTTDKYLTNSFVSFFKTATTDTRDVACLYNILNDFTGEDCAECSVCGFSTDIGGSHDMCDYPSFWMKIPKADGGRLVFPAQTLTGNSMDSFRSELRELKAQGGSAIAETLYDVWRYLGGMKPLHDDGGVSLGAKGAYESPFSDPSCFINEAIIISGGQPQYDDNYKIAPPSTFTNQSPTWTTARPAPYVEPDNEDIIREDRPYSTKNWYLTSLENVAAFVHNSDFFHSVPECRENNDMNAYGYEANSLGSCTVGTGGTDGTGENVVDKIHAVAIGDWALSSLYMKLNTEDTEDYLNTSIIERAAVNNGGQYYGLTAETNLGTNTFNNLTDMFKKFNKEGSDVDRAAGRPHWTSPPVQPLGASGRVRGPDAYMPVTIPIDSATSRFWFGNLKRYRFDDDALGCGQMETPEIDTESPSYDSETYQSLTFPANDCFSPSDTGMDVTDIRFRKLNTGGVADLIAKRLTACSSVPCFKTASRNILYDNNNDILLKKLTDLVVPPSDADPATGDFLRVKSQFNLGVTASEDKLNNSGVVKILDYIYGYDSYSANETAIRYSSMPTIEIDDPFLLDFDSTAKTTIRPLLMGAITHSKPVAVHYETSEETRVFVGANDGMLHSFDQDGKEQFAYIPSPSMPALKAISNANAGIVFRSSVDGPIELFHMDANNDGMITPGEKAYLIFGYRRGANAYTVLDISEMDNPRLVQHIGTEGQSWAKPLSFMTNGSYYLLIPGGYDTCFDADVPSKANCGASGGALDPKGNEFKIYKFNESKQDATGAFELIKEYKPGDGTAYADWLRASFTADPIALNTVDPLTKGAELVYLIDVTGTVFRINVSAGAPDSWDVDVVYAQRDSAYDVQTKWMILEHQKRTYANFSIYPFKTTYPSQENNKIVPVPIVTGNLVNPQASTLNGMVLFYDDKTDSPTSPAVNTGGPDFPNVSLNFASEVENEAYYASSTGWRIPFDQRPDTNGLFMEKGITRPLIYYDRWDSNTYTLLWNTYLPAEWKECRNFGTSLSYARDLWTGKKPQLGPYSDFDSGVYWEAGKSISIATDIGVLATKKGESIVFASGDDLFATKSIEPPDNSVNIIKWYELY